MYKPLHCFSPCQDTVGHPGISRRQGMITDRNLRKKLVKDGNVSRNPKSIADFKQGSFILLCSN